MDRIYMPELGLETSKLLEVRLRNKKNILDSEGGRVNCHSTYD
jgi:hypothetical protein